jgi:hypothetical protein
VDARKALCAVLVVPVCRVAVQHDTGGRGGAARRDAARGRRTRSGRSRQPLVRFRHLNEQRVDAAGVGDGCQIGASAFARVPCAALMTAASCGSCMSSGSQSVGTATFRSLLWEHPQQRLDYEVRGPTWQGLAGSATAKTGAAAIQGAAFGTAPPGASYRAGRRDAACQPTHLRPAQRVVLTGLVMEPPERSIAAETA